jgi:hypothetical protein
MKRGGTMSKVYVVVENNKEEPGVLYPDLYYTYENARDAVITKYDVDDDDEDVYVKENTNTGRTKLYVEKGINIIIQRYMLDKSK